MSNVIEHWVDPHFALALLKPKAGYQLCRGCCLGSGTIAKPKQKPKRNEKRVVVSVMSHSSAVPLKRNRAIASKLGDENMSTGVPSDLVYAVPELAQECRQKGVFIWRQFAHLRCSTKTRPDLDAGGEILCGPVEVSASRDPLLMLQSPSASVETKSSWAVASAALFILGMSFGAAWITAVALKDIANEVDGTRSVPALASALAWLGSGSGGIIMARIAERIGTRSTVIFGSLMIGLGLSISTLGLPWPLWIGHGVFIGLIGIGGINAPLYIYVSRWFDRRRGSALALISSGTYLAGTIWPPIFEYAIANIGWRQAMLWYAVAEILVVVPLATIYFQAPPEVVHPAAASGPSSNKALVLGWQPNAVFAMMCCAAVLCCIPMAMPQGHLVAFCSDLGISRSTGALMLSVLLGTAFLSRQIWGVISDRIGGLTTVLIGSAWQATSMTAFLLTQNEAGLFAVTAAFGLGFSGIIPAYVLAVRELFPASEASWRIPTLLLFSGGGMGAGGWIAGLLYDHFGYYEPAFAVGIGTNILNLLMVSVLVGRQRHRAVYV
jgi:MFS family permease